MQYRRARLASLLADSVRDFLSTIDTEALPDGARRRISALRTALEIWEGKSHVGEVRPMSGFRRKTD